MFKSIILALVICLPLIGFGQDSSKVSVDTFDWDTTGLYYFLYNDQKDIQTIINESVTDSFKREIVRIFNDRSGLNLVDTLTESPHKLEWRFRYDEDSIEWGKIPPKLDEWTYHLAEECLTDFIYLKISSRPIAWKEFGVKVYASFNYWHETDLWWEVDVVIFPTKED